MPVDVVVDDSVFDQINRGNAALGAQLKRLFDTGTSLWITKELYTQLAKVPANRQMMMDLQVRSPMQDKMPNDSTHGAADDIRQGQRLDQIPYRKMTTANLAFGMKAQLMTADAEFESAYRNQRGQILETYSKEQVEGPINYSAGRMVLGLPPMSVREDGSIGPKPPPVRYAPAAPQIVLQQPGGGKPKSIGRYVNGYQRGITGSPVEPVFEGQLNGTPGANFNLQVGLRLANFAVQWLNDMVQKQRFDKRMRSVQAEVGPKLDEEPTLGALIVVYFRKMKKVGAEEDSPLEHVAVFDDIVAAYGRTKEEARGNFPATISGGEGELITQEEWIPPRQAVSVDQIPTPFKKSALATFVPGLEELVAVSFSFAAGFDDKIRSRILLNDRRHKNARFILMEPPESVEFYWNGQKRTKDITNAFCKPAEIIDSEQSLYYVPCIRLDSFVNPYDALAAMVYPADDYTANLFDSLGRVEDSGLLLRYRMDLVRFVKPSKIRLLEDFAQFNPPMSSD